MTKGISALLAVPLSMSLLTFTACGGDAQTAVDTATTKPAVEEPLDDSRINSAVQAKVFASDGLSSRNVEITTLDGVVTLKGVVENETVKKTALSVAAEGEGVKRVEDKLTIDPTWRARLESQGANAK